MKTNLPVTRNEVQLREGQVIVTKTDIKGQIVFANDDFCEISGFSISELAGRNHNIVRHPDMPPEAFADLWDTLNEGKPWTGIIKNRCKNGDFYWVKTYVAPIHDNHVIVGYLSSRVKPSRDEVSAAEELYADIRERRGKYRLDHGRLIPTGFFHRMNPLRPLDTARVRTQLSVMLASFLVTILIAAAIGYVALEKLRVNGPAYARIIEGKDLVADVLPPPQYLIESWLLTHEMLQTPPGELHKLIEASGQLQRDYETRHTYWMDQLEPGPLKDTLVVTSYAPAKKFFELRDQKFIPALQAGNVELANSILPEMRKTYLEHRSAIDDVVRMANTRNREDEADAEQQIKSTYGFVLSVILALTLLTGLVGWRIVRSITGSLGGEPRYAAEIVRHIAAGNLGVYVQTNSSDASLLGGIRNMQEKLQKTIGEIQSNSESVAGIAKELSASASHVRDVSSQQSESAANIATAGEEMTSSIAYVAENAESTREVSINSGNLCHSGADVIRNAVSSMQQIAETVRSTSSTMTILDQQSARISSVVMVIRDIAEQTNLLALNAAIEAARAGEQGRGFAVVADEVRKLAERTANSTQEISGVIDEIQSRMRSASNAMQSGVVQVEDGVRLASEAGRAIAEIQDSAQKVVLAVTEISEAMQEQSRASQNVAANVERIAHMSEASSAAANQTSSASDQLEKAARNLARTISRFAV